mmetsp:Transcript_35434/g.75533  ORF Transcript_35434/g.75533 Transcript_35434/m.75533 type:complete len:448 (+) Transcript_35434:207-1550(+)
MAAAGQGSHIQPESEPLTVPLLLQTENGGGDGDAPQSQRGGVRSQKVSCCGRRLWLAALTLCLTILAVVVIRHWVIIYIEQRCDPRAPVINRLFEGRSLHPKFPKAVCLDGSPGRYYIRHGWGGGADKWVFYFEGYNYCADALDCASRIPYWYGSTTADPDYDPPRKLMQTWSPWQFHPSCVTNPLMYNWNQVLIRYCDGGYFAGDREEPVHAKGTTEDGDYVDTMLFYRGRYITEGVFQDLFDRGRFGSASDIVVSGCSSGGANVLAHLDYMRSRLLPSGARVVGLVDSGFYLDPDDEDLWKRYLVYPQGQNGTAMINASCLQRFADSPEKCLMGVISAGYCNTDLFLWQSRYDVNQEWDCWPNAQCYRDFGDNITYWINRTILNRPRNAAFVDSCSRHCPSGIAHSDVTGRNVMQYFADWYNGVAGVPFLEGQFKHTYPCKGCCT